LSTGEQTTAGTSKWTNIIRSSGVKFLVLGTSALLGLLTTRLIIENFGIDSYAQYGLLVGLGALIPFGALGIGAPIMNSIGEAEAPSDDERVRLVLMTSIRILIVAAAVLIALAVVFSLTGSWYAILGDGLLPETGGIAAGLVFFFIALAMPFGIGQRILTGLGKNHISIALSGLQSPIVLLTVIVAISLGASVGSFVAVVPYIALVLIGMLSTYVGGRMIRPALTWARRNALILRGRPGSKIMDQAWPMTVIMIALPVGMQTDRLVLSHVAGVEELATYNLAAQMYLPIGALVSAAGLTLWPMFAAARSDGRTESPFPTSLVFGGIAVAMTAAVTLLAPLLAQIASGGSVELTGLIMLSFSVWMVLQAVQYPMGMYLTSLSGLRFQAFMVTLMVPVNIGLSWYLAQQIGAAGPVIGSAVGVLVFQVVANFIYIRRSSRQ
jgi:O-antigen/teichoic acid export membrane protein